MLKLRAPALVLLAAALAVPASAHKERDWQTGKVLDPRNSPYYAESAVDAPYGDSGVPIRKVYEPFLIEGPASAYFAREGRAWEWSRSAHLRVNETVKFAVHGRKMYVIDDRGKERRLEITKTVARKSDQ